MIRALPRRAGDAGVTLVEILVVLVLIGTVAGAVGLSLGNARRGASVDSETALLLARMRRASDEALLAGAPVALTWDNAGYRFLAWADGGWQPHPVSILGTPHLLPDGVGFLGPSRGGDFVVGADLLPQDGAALRLALGPDGSPAERAPQLIWDGATARLEEAGA